MKSRKEKKEDITGKRKKKEAKPAWPGPIQLPECAARVSRRMGWCIGAPIMFPQKIMSA
jgi:hypothetical protein